MKIENQFNKSIDQKNEIEQQESINQSNDSNVVSANSINQYIKKIENLNSEWVTLEHLTDEVFFPTTSARIVYQILAYEWIVDLDFLPEDLIPYLNVQILYKSPENLAQRAIDDSSILFKTGNTIQLEETDDASKITLVADMFIRQATTGELDIEDVEAKLLLTLQNPNNYV